MGPSPMAALRSLAGRFKYPLGRPADLGFAAYVQICQNQNMAGRHSKFNDALQGQMLTLYKEGKTDLEVARAVGISVRTVHNWKARNSAFLHSIKEAKAVADARVESALYLRATGYSYPTEKVFCSDGKIIRAETLKHCPPDVTAMIFWLKNRRPDLWR